MGFLDNLLKTTREKVYNSEFAQGVRDFWNKPVEIPQIPKADPFQKAMEAASTKFPSVQNYVNKQYDTWKARQPNQLANQIADKAGSLWDSAQEAAPRVMDTVAQGVSKVNIPVSSPLLPNKGFNIPVGKFVADNFLYNPESQRAFPNSPAWALSDAEKIQDPEEKQKALSEVALNMVMAGTINSPTAKSANIIDDVTPQVTNQYLKLKGSKQPDFIAEAGGAISKVKDISKKKLAEILPKAEQAATQASDDIAGLLPAGNVPKPALQLPEGLNPQKEAINVGKTSWWNEKTLEPKRFFKKVLPENLQKVADDTIFAPLNKLRGQAADMKNAYISQLQKLGKEFKTGSEYSKFTQMFGEGKVTPEQLVAKFGDEGAAKIESADKFFRNAYNTLLENVNKNRQAAGLDLIKQRQDYYRHMGELGGDQNWLSRLVNGGSGEKSRSIRTTRKGGETTYDAVAGFIDYLDKAGRAAYTDTISPTIKKLADQLEKGGAPEQVIGYLRKYSDQILGITKDEGALVNTVNNVASKMRGSQVLGNVSSLVNQTASLPIGINTAGWNNYTKAIFSKEANAASKLSPYLKDRAFSTPLSLMGGIKDKVVGTMGKVLQSADTTITKSVWKAFYEKAKAQGVDDAIKFADDTVESIVGSRGIGGYSQWQQSKLGQILAPFTSEAQSAGNKIIDLIGERKAGTLLGIIVTNHLFNNASEKVTGQRPTFDPIQAVVDSYRLYTGDKNTSEDKVKAAARLVTETLQLNPIAQSMAANIYSLGESALPDIVPDSREIFGSEDPTRMNVGDLYNPLKSKNITGNKVADTAITFGSKFIPGGNQLTKSLSGILANERGYVSSKNGKVMFETPKDTLGKVQSVVFGPNATKAAKDYYNNSYNRPLTEQQTAVYKSLPENERTKYLQSVNESTQNVNRVKEKATNVGVDKNGVYTPGSGITPKTSAEKKAIKEYVTTALEGGQTPDEADISNGYFDGKKANTSNLEDKFAVYGKIKSAVDNEFYTDEQKDAIIKASGAKKEDVEYYLNASTDDKVRLQKLLPYMNTKDHDKAVTGLMQLRRTVGDKAVLTDGMVDYLYEKDLISQDEQEVLKAIKYDEINGEFYIKKAFAKKGEGKKLTYAQASKLFNFDNLAPKTTNAISKLLATNTSTSSNTRLVQEILGSGYTPKLSGKKLWFKPY